MTTPSGRTSLFDGESIDLQSVTDKFEFDIAGYHYSDPDRYELVGKISKGKFHLNYEGIDSKTNQRVAIKIHPPVRL